MLEPQILDRAEELGLEEEVAKAGAVDAYVRALVLAPLRARTVRAIGGCSGGGRSGGLGGAGSRGEGEVVLLRCGEGLRLV